MILVESSSISGMVDNTLVRGHGTEDIQASGILIDDNDNITVNGEFYIGSSAYGNYITFGYTGELLDGRLRFTSDYIELSSGYVGVGLLCATTDANATTYIRNASVSGGLSFSSNALGFTGMTDNRILRGDSNTGIQISAASIDDSGNFTGVVSITSTGNHDFQGERIQIGGNSNNAIINANFSMYFNIDGDNNGTTEKFQWGKNALTTSATALMTLDENGDLTLHENGLNLSRSTGAGYINIQDGSNVDKWILQRSSSNGALSLHAYGSSGAAGLLNFRSASASTIYTLGVDTANNRVGVGYTGSGTIPSALYVSSGTGITSGISITDVETDGTTKDGRIRSLHYTNSEEPLGVIRGRSTSSNNTIYYGGGDSSVNTAQNHEFYTAANNATVSGTLAMYLNHTDGLYITNKLAVGTQALVPPTTLLVVGGTTSAIGITIQNVITDSTTKDGRIKVGHYTNSEEPVTAFIISAASSTSTMYIGGGSASENAITVGYLYAAANNTTLTGTAIVEWDINKFDMKKAVVRSGTQAYSGALSTTIGSPTAITLDANVSILYINESNAVAPYTCYCTITGATNIRDLTVIHVNTISSFSVTIINSNTGELLGSYGSAHFTYNVGLALWFKH